MEVAAFEERHLQPGPPIHSTRVFINIAHDRQRLPLPLRLLPGFGEDDRW